MPEIGEITKPRLLKCFDALIAYQHKSRGDNFTQFNSTFNINRLFEFLPLSRYTEKYNNKINFDEFKNFE